ncbi:MAG: rod shape-determining protein MreC [Dehalococcoidia bacterium]|nr:rod shape-determining protein MreC [Dehalococcoidia bacterium]
MRVIWWLATVVAVSLISIVFSHQRTLDPLQNLSLTATSPLQNGLRDIASPLNDIYDGIIDHGGLVRENERLREEVERLQQQLAEQQDAQQRIRELEDALEVKQSRPEDQLLAANVIAQDPSGLKRAIAIDRGQDDGVDEGMVILSRSGALVGSVSRAYRDFAWVRLITDPDSAVNAQVNVQAQQPQPAATPQVLTGGTPAASPSPSPAASAAPAPVGAGGGPAADDGPARGVAAGDLRDDLVLDLLPTDAHIAKGSLVMTSGLGGNFPPGILIGSVKTVQERPQSPFKKAGLLPATRLANLDTVLVLISFKPARLTAP